jgi:hypothetical protein
MANSPQNVSIDPREADRAVSMWEGFTKFMTVGIIGVVMLLVLMAFFLL